MHSLSGERQLSLRIESPEDQLPGRESTDAIAAASCSRR
jgi:hypothetical protein